MKATTKICSLLAASLLAFAPVARAQLVSAATIDYIIGSTTPFGAHGTASQTRGQTFTDILAINSLTYTLLANNTASNATGSLSATFGEWNGTSFVSGSTVSLGTVNVAAPSTWSSMLINGNLTPVFNFTLDLSFTQYGTNMNPTKTYAVMLTNLGASTTFGLSLTDWEYYGDVFSSTGVGNPNSAAGGGAAAPAGFSASGQADWGFSSLVYVPNGNVVPVPESSTIAAIIGIILVAGLAGFRIAQRRKQILVSAVTN